MAGNVTDPGDNLAWLARWYAEQCDGDWEHAYGIAIDTLDNPGWSIKVDLKDTALEALSVEPESYNLDTPDGDPALHWHHCAIRECRFERAGGVGDLQTIIGIFRRWAEPGASR